MYNIILLDNNMMMKINFLNKYVIEHVGLLFYADKNREKRIRIDIVLYLSVVVVVFCIIVFCEIFSYNKTR